MELSPATRYRPLETLEARVPPTAPQRSRWKNEINNLAEGDVVLVKDLDLFQRSWSMGRVIKTFLGSDDLVRAVDILMHGKTLRRPVTTLVKLLGGTTRGLPLRGSYVQVTDRPFSLN